MNPINILSLGAGVQSTCILLMSEKGILPKFHAAIFADTGWEMPDTYRHVEWMKTVCQTPIIVVKAGNVREGSFRKKSGKTLNLMPKFIVGPDGRTGRGMRQCTSVFKIMPIRRKVRELLGATKHDRLAPGIVREAIGFDVDELRRISTSDVKYINLWFPLVELRMTRQDCKNWIEANHPGHVPVKSACVGCPFRQNSEWRQVKCDDCAWKEAVEYDESQRNYSGKIGFRTYLHRSCKPLAEVDLDDDGISVEESCCKSIFKQADFLFMSDLGKSDLEARLERERFRTSGIILP